MVDNVPPYQTVMPPTSLETRMVAHQAASNNKKLKILQLQIPPPLRLALLQPQGSYYIKKKLGRLHQEIMCFILLRIFTFVFMLILGKVKGLS